MELSSPKIRKFLIPFGLSPQNFSLKNFLYFFLKRSALEKFLIFSQKKLFLYFGKAIFKTLAYLELEAYSEPWYIGT